MEFSSLAEIITAVVVVLSGQKGFEVYKRKKHSNGGHDRRSGNSFCQSDKDFIENCFNFLTKKNDRLELVAQLGGIIRDEGRATREAIRS